MIPATTDFRLNVAIVAQAGRIGYQALLCVASIRAFHSAEFVRIFVCIPHNSNMWQTDPSVSDVGLQDEFKRYDCEVTYFDNVHFGSNYPYSNKFYAILSLPTLEPFVFLDSDCILLAPIRPESLNLAQPALRPATAQWPVKDRSTYSIAEIWRSLYDLFGIDPSPYFDAALGENVAQCYPYYSAAVMYYAQAGLFGKTMLDMAIRIWSSGPNTLDGQPLKPWLDQIVLPLTLAKLGVPRRKKIDQFRRIICHYQFPFFLMVRYGDAIERFSELLKDSRLASVLRRDSGFGYYLSDEGRELTEKTHSQFLNSPAKSDYTIFKTLMRQSAPRMR